MFGGFLEPSWGGGGGNRFGECGILNTTLHKDGDTLHLPEIGDGRQADSWLASSYYALARLGEVGAREQGVAKQLFVFLRKIPEDRI